MASAPKVLLLLPPMTVPALIVSPPVQRFVTAPSVRLETVLFWITPVTFAPMTPLMRVAPAPLAPELVMVPVGLTEPERVMPVPAVLLIAFRVRLPDPVMLPVPTVVLPVVPVLVMVRLFASVMAPLKIAAVVPPLFPMVSVLPLLPEITLMGLETVKLLASTLALLFPVVSPSLTALALGPNAPLTVVALLTLASAVPELTNTPPVKVLAPVKVAVPL